MSFPKGLIIGVLFAIVLALVARHFGLVRAQPEPGTPVELARQAMAALDAVKKRQPGERRPASYDAVMKPFDQLLEQAKTLLSSESYHPENDTDKVRALVAPVLDIAPLAVRQARSETGPLVKEYRFNDQIGEACQYLASSLWRYAEARRAASTGRSGETPPPPQATMNELRQVLDKGLEADPNNRDLWYLNALVHREEGLFPAARSDLERAINIDPEYAEGYNTLGLVLISLKEFDKAEEAYLKARELVLAQAKEQGLEPGPEYAAILYNLASFHDNLATFYNRENRINPSTENRRLLTHHVAEADKYWREFLTREPPESQDARAARARLQALPR